MRVEIEPGKLRGAARVPGSKSHTIRALVIASLASGESSIRAPLDSHDTQACIHACRMLGASVTESRNDDTLTSVSVQGVGGKPQTPESVIDVGNSGTTLYILTTTAALADGWTVFNGDGSIRNRPVEPLLSALRDLGADTFTTRGNGKPPFLVRGPLGGGADGAAAGTRSTTIECRTSQYLSSLLLGLPLGSGNFEINVPLLYERPYVDMTFWWLDGQGIHYNRKGYEHLSIPGGQAYKAFSIGIPGDFSSATFLFCAAAITGSAILLEGLDMSDPQGDKAVLDCFEAMGCAVEDREEGLSIEGPDELIGGTFDLNSMPDTLPALAVAACCARTETRLVNVPQARQKETDRIAVMASELRKMGATITELDDGLVISPAANRRAPLRGTDVESHDDHRVAMALSVAGLVASGQTRVSGAECAAVTFPGFFKTLNSLRA